MQRYGDLTHLYRELEARVERAYQHAKEDYRLEDWLRNSTFLVHYMREETGKLTT